MGLCMAVVQATTAACQPANRSGMSDILSTLKILKHSKAVTRVLSAWIYIHWRWVSLVAGAQRRTMHGTQSEKARVSVRVKVECRAKSRMF